jgi:hypothetical protein
MKAASSVQVNATTGNGETLLLPEPRLVTFKTARCQLVRLPSSVVPKIRL